MTIFMTSIKTDKIQKNVFGEELETCSKDPLTGWYRDGASCHVGYRSCFYRSIPFQLIMEEKLK